MKIDNKHRQADKAYQPTAPATLEAQIMDCRIPKNEREWWAKREIERLREDHERTEGNWLNEHRMRKAAEAERAAAAVELLVAAKKLAEARAERDALKALLTQVTEKWIEDADPRECPELCASVKAALREDEK